jgi:hypothetical protein
MREQKIEKLSSDVIDPPVEPTEDTVYRLASAAFALVATVDYGASSELFRTFVQAPSDRRTRQAITLIIDALNQIIDRVNRPLDRLQDDEAFISTMATAYSMATRSAESEKLSAIKQAVICSALENAPNEATQQMYLTALADMTSIHLRLLRYFKALDFSTVKSANAGDRTIQNNYFRKVMPYLAEDTFRPLIERASRDLHSWGVIAVPEGCSQSMSGPNFITMMLTDFGKGFIDFIEA